MPPCGRRPFLDENWGGCPLTLDVLGRWRPLISRVLGAAPGPFIVALSTRIRFAFCPAAPAGDCRCWSEPKEAGVLEETHDRDQIIQRVAALDVGKAELTCCVRVPGQGSSGRRRQEVTAYQTMTRWLLVMADRLAELGVTRVVMEATSDYWKGVYYLLEAHGFEVWLVNARDVKHLPGRPKTDTLDAVGCVSWPSGSCCGPASCHHR